MATNVNVKQFFVHSRKLFVMYQYSRTWDTKMGQPIVKAGKVRFCGFYRALNPVIMVLILALALPASAVWASQSSTKSASVSTKHKAKNKAAKTKSKYKQSRQVRNARRHQVDDPLRLQSAVALVVDQDTGEVLVRKNAENAAVPIASITKLMTALVTIDAHLDLEEELRVSRADKTADRIHSRLRPGIRLTRAEALHLALMSSENHAAHLLGRTYPGGIKTFVDAMNAKARLLGMDNSHFADPTGLSAQNRSSPKDLVRLVQAAYEYPLIREYTTSRGYDLAVGKRSLRYGNTNRLTANPDWEIGLQKTGYISAAGRCLVMQAVIDGRRVVMVLLDSVGKYSRLGDAQRIRQYLTQQNMQQDQLAVRD